MVLVQLGKEMPSENLRELTSSSPESGESSLGNGHSLSEVINDWKRELVEKNCTLHEKISQIHSLEEQLKLKESEICEIINRTKTVEIDRDKNCQMVTKLEKSNEMSFLFLKTFLKCNQRTCCNKILKHFVINNICRLGQSTEKCHSHPQRLNTIPKTSEGRTWR